MATSKKTATRSQDITQLIADYTAKRNERLDLDEKSKKLKVAEDSLLDKLTELKVPSGVYGPYDLKVTLKKVPRCTDWPNFHAYLKQTGNFDMLHKRLTDTAIMARVNDGEYVPGIVLDDKVSYTVKPA